MSEWIIIEWNDKVYAKSFHLFEIRRNTSAKWDKIKKISFCSKEFFCYVQLCDGNMLGSFDKII